MRECVARDIGEWDKQRPLNHEDACSRQGEDFVLVNPKVRPEVLFDVLRGSDLGIAAYEQVGNDQEGQEHKG